MSMGINLADYQVGKYDNSALFDQNTQEGYNDLSKALEALSITGRETTDSLTDSGAPLKVESLEKNLKLITFREQDIKLFRDMPNSPAYNTVEEFAQLVDYGVERGGFTNEGELPVEEDSTYRRRAEFVKFLGVTKSVTHQMQLVNTVVGAIVQREIKNGTMWILRKVDRALTTGDANLIPQEFNGLYTQHQRSEWSTLDAYLNSGLVIDLRGNPLTQVDVENGAQQILDNYGAATKLYAPPKVLAGLAVDLYSKQRIILGSTPNNNLVAGGAPKSVSTSVGEIEMVYDIFMRKAKGKLASAGADTLDSPNTPISGSQAVVTDTNTSFGKVAGASLTGAGDYKYAVAGINRYGESALLVINASAATVSASQSVDLTFSDGGGANPATGYVVYRTKKNDTSATPQYFPIFTVNLAEKAAGYNGAAAGVVRDSNKFITDCDQAFIAEFTEDVIMWKQLAPLMKMDLARISPAYRFMVLLYGTPQMYAPKKFVRYINIGPAVGIL